MHLVSPYVYDFRAVSYAARVYSGRDALAALPAELRRQRARRAYIVCGRSVSRKTGLIARIRNILGDSCAGLYDEMGKDTPVKDVLAARDGARAAGADLLIAVGAGSVVQGTRIVAILLAEEGPVEELCTRYPEDGGSAISPKLTATKLPIINILTAATTAQNHGGSPMKAEGVDHRMEFFDPKTRPVALFWDAEALLTAPASMMRASATAIFWRATMNMGHTRATPLVALNRRQVFELTRDALPRLQDANDAAPRIELCAATYLLNRDVDDGGERARHWVSRVGYAFATALFNLYEQVSQGEAYAALTPTIMRMLGSRDPDAMCGIAQALRAWREGDPVADAPMRAAAELERIFSSHGLHTRLSLLDIPRSSTEAVLTHSLKNFNSDPKREFMRERELLRKVLEASW
ncbi:MAG: iron-containing alcohol dehydrogenase family protein [Pseudomonadota bacterium]